MNMLTKVEIFNFQCHKKTTAEFVPGTNVIIGESDAGKSAVFRAINWVISNRPLGDSFRSEWGGDTKVVLYTAEGDVIERIRSATRNEYIINGKVLKAFGTEVPEDVVTLLQLDSANIQTQDDSAFLLADSPGEAARQLNRAASIDNIDHTISNLKRAHTKIDNENKFIKNKLFDYEEELQQYDNIPLLENKLQLIEHLEKEIEKKQGNLSQLARIVSEIGKAAAQLQKTENVPALLKKQIDIQKKYDAFQDKKELLEQLRRVAYEIQNIQAYLRSTAYVEKALLLTLETYENRMRAQQRAEQLEKLRQLVRNITRTSKSIDSIQKKLDEQEQEFYELLPDSCPLCGNETGLTL